MMFLHFELRAFSSIAGISMQLLYMLICISKMAWDTMYVLTTDMIEA